jgi:hypothetical protein
MSLELHAFLRSATLPSVAEWQASITDLAFPLQLDPSLDLATAGGFVPCRVNDEASGVEMWVDSVAELVAAYPEIEAIVGSAHHVVSFRWGGDLKECACAMGAAAGLIGPGGALIYYPADDMWYELDGLRDDFAAAISQ